MDALRAYRSVMEPDQLWTLYRSVRAATRALAANLSDADASAQSMPDASPAKWHLAHTSWFFETMVLKAHWPSYKVFDERYNFLFNSYYESVGVRHARPERGLLTRPTLEKVNAYRDYIDVNINKLLESTPSAFTDLIELGIHHEQQHQELLLTDILHLFSKSPLKPIYKAPEPLPVKQRAVVAPKFLEICGGLIKIGHKGAGFAFDVETPRHRVFLEDYRLSDRLVNNREWIDFMEDGGYENPLLWLSDGWACVLAHGWKMPLYWERRGEEYWSMTLRGFQPLDLDAPVTHVSYYEADAYAAWAGARLATEDEWEHAAVNLPLAGNFVESGRLRPSPPSQGAGLHQMFGDVWEWTRSAFSAYPRFKPAAGALGEYNGKFMSGKFVLRGGSCVTPESHMRASYRNFFPPDARWQFSGVRLAQDAPDNPAGLRVKTDTTNDNALILSGVSGSTPPLTPEASAFQADVLAGLARRQKCLPSRWLYDDLGSALFEEITHLEEYYPTRTETSILRDRSKSIADFCGENAAVLEYGAGAGIKTELLLKALANPRFYVPVDIAADFLDQTVSRLRKHFKDLAIRPVVADFSTDFDLPAWLPLSHRVAFFPGSTIGNLDEQEAASFLARVRAHVGLEGKALIGLDLRKSLQVLIPAYDDAKGVTAQFNLNLLTRINRELGGTFDLAQFRHQVKWSEKSSAIEMHLRSLKAQSVKVAGHTFQFRQGESIHTESSRKYDLEAFKQLCAGNGWQVAQVWTDAQNRFAVVGLV